MAQKQKPGKRRQGPKDKREATPALQVLQNSINLLSRLGGKLPTASSREGTPGPPADDGRIKRCSSANLTWRAYISPLKDKQLGAARAFRKSASSRPVCPSASRSGGPQGAVTQRPPVYQLSATKVLLQQILLLFGLKRDVIKRKRGVVFFSHQQLSDRSSHQFSLFSTFGSSGLAPSFGCCFSTQTSSEWSF